MNVLDSVQEEKGDVRNFMYAGIDIFSLPLQSLRNLLAHELEQVYGFTFDWSKGK